MKETNNGNAQNIDRQLASTSETLSISLSDGILTLVFCFLHGPETSGTNYFDVKQNSDELKQK